MQSILLLTLFVLAVTAVPDNAQRIVGGSVTTINQYPFGAALLFSANLITYVQLCGGTIINKRSILSAAHCFVGHTANMWRVRVGSTFASSGGTVINIAAIIMHNYDIFTIDNDIAILRTASSIVYSNVVQPASIAGANYNLADNQAVWAMGWGATAWTGSFVEQLRHVQVWTVNQNECNTRYNGAITANMLCAGWLDVGDRGTCQGDSGGPLLHNNVVVGITSWGVGCGNAFFPGVNARVSQYTSWITANA